MRSDDDESLEDLECDRLAECNGSQVAIARNVRDEYDALPTKQLGRFQRAMEMWCEGHRLPKEMWNANEGRSPKQNLLIQAIKAFKVRLYGFVRHVGDKKTFIIVDLDPAKKQDKADPIIVKRAKSRAELLGKRKKR